MTQENMSTRDPLADYWDIYGKRDLRGLAKEIVELYQVQPEPVSPWTSGRYALAAIVWGAIALVVLGLGAGP